MNDIKIGSFIIESLEVLQNMINLFVDSMEKVPVWLCVCNCRKWVEAGR